MDKSGEAEKDAVGSGPHLWGTELWKEDDNVNIHSGGTEGSPMMGGQVSDGLRVSFHTSILGRGGRDLKGEKLDKWKKRWVLGK